MLDRSGVRIVYLPLIFFLVFVCSGCATIRHPLPKDLLSKAKVDNMAEIRTIMGIPNPVLQENIINSIKEENPADYPAGIDGVKVYPMLAVSGGSANGAYGAGLLKGWSAEGSRPVFKIVTGVSTGAIIAPFAFLGKEYDDELEKLYTSMSTASVMRPKRPFQALLGDSLATNTPLERQINAAVDAKILEKIANEHRRGRRLFVGTTLLDAQRFVVWDMGAIACRGDVGLFRKVILASAAIPVIFPPVYIHVEADGNSYDEMHVDGGTVTQVFTLYKVLDTAGNLVKEHNIDASKIRGKCYIIRNGYVTPDYKAVKDNLSSIADRAFDTMINSQGVGDTYRLYTYMKKIGNDYNLAFIPPDFRPEKKEEFDPKAMKELFDRGYQDAVKGYKWHKEPPGLEAGKF